MALVVFMSPDNDFGWIWRLKLQSSQIFICWIYLPELGSFSIWQTRVIEFCGLYGQISRFETGKSICFNDTKNLQNLIWTSIKLSFIFWPKSPANFWFSVTFNSGWSILWKLEKFIFLIHVHVGSHHIFQPYSFHPLSSAT